MSHPTEPISIGSQEEEQGEIIKMAAAQAQTMELKTNATLNEISTTGVLLLCHWLIIYLSCGGGHLPVNNETLCDRIAMRTRMYATYALTLRGIRKCAATLMTHLSIYFLVSRVIFKCTFHPQEISTRNDMFKSECPDCHAPPLKRVRFGRFCSTGVTFILIEN